MSKKLILLVDDEETILMLNEHRLRQAGYEVETASDGSEGLQKARALHPAVIVLDVMLPKLDGYKVCQMLKFDENYRDIPIILLTAMNLDQDKQTGLQTGADIYMVKTDIDGKSFSHELVDQIETLVGSAEG